MTRFNQRILIALCLMGVQSAYSDSTIRKWVDDKGQVHYGNVAPGKHPVRTLQSLPAPTAGESQAAAERTLRERQQLTKWETTRPRIELQDPDALVSCARALEIIEFLGSHHELPVLRPLDDGGVALMGEPDRGTYLDSARARVAEDCKSSDKVDMQELWSGLFWPRTARAAIVTPTQFITPPTVREADARIKGAPPDTRPTNPTTSIINAKRPTAPANSITSLVNAKRPTSANNSGAGTFK